MEAFELKNVKIVDRTATFSVVSGDFSIDCVTILSSRMIEYINKIELREIVANESERMEIIFLKLRRLIGEDNVDKVQEYLEVTSKSLKDDFEALGSILTKVNEEILPKLRASVEKG